MTDANAVPPGTVALVSCAKAKRTQAAAAADLYVSPLFQKMAAFARATCSRWYILSAKHGLLSPDALIAPYDVTLGTLAPRAA